MSVLCVCVRRLCVPNIMSLSVCFKELNPVKVGTFAWCSVKIHVSSVSGLKEEKLIKKSKPTRKLKHTNTILEYFEYFCQMTSKSILIISSYTVSKLRRFFETQCRSHCWVLFIIAMLNWVTLKHTHSHLFKIKVGHLRWGQMRWDEMRWNEWYKHSLIKHFVKMYTVSQKSHKFHTVNRFYSEGWFYCHQEIF